MELPEHFPALPSAAPHMHWSADMVQAHQTLTNIFNSARTSLNLDESDTIRLQFHLDRAINEVVPILDAISSHEDNPLPADVVEHMVLAMALLVVHLRSALESSQTRSVLQLKYELEMNY